MDHLLHGIDVRHLRHAHLAAVDHLPMRRDDVSRQDRCAYDFGQERIEGDEVLLTDERQVPVGRQGVFQLLRGFIPAKPPPMMTRFLCISVQR
jgi:hypothetical protein